MAINIIFCKPDTSYLIPDSGIYQASKKRFILPLYTNTNIDTGIDGRSLFHLYNMSKETQMPSVIKNMMSKVMKKLKTISPIVLQQSPMTKEVLAYFPSARLFAKTNKNMNKDIKKYGNKNIDLLSFCGAENLSGLEKTILKRDEAELSNLKHIHFTFLEKITPEGSKCNL